MIPLEFAPKFTAGGYDVELLKELVASGNALRELMLRDLASTLPGAHIGALSCRCCVLSAETERCSPLRRARALRGHARQPRSVPQRHSAAEHHQRRRNVQGHREMRKR